ncbi:MAG: NAD(P)-dependent oxidoreductase [Alphaproteobacteria bacterium]|nr:NAD(P)-dependent oxidoreductase [Alphaproteobacteria bacterium]
MKLGFIGLGAMGLPMATRLVERNHAVTVLDLNEAATAALAARGAAVARTPAEVAQDAEIVFTCLPTLDSVRAVALGTHGVIHGKAPIYVNLSTIGSPLSREIATALAARGIATLDAPITGGAPKARDGTLTVMVAGERAAFDQVETVFGAFANNVVYLGAQPGIAQTMKLINNIMSAANLAIAAEAMVMGAKAGLDPEAMLKVLNTGSGQNSATLTKIPNHVLTRTFDYGGALYIIQKDLEAWRQEAEALGVPSWVGSAVRQLYLHTLAAGSPKDDMTTVVRLIEGWAGAELQKTR